MDKELFAKKLKMALAENGMKQIDLARKTGLNKGQISQYLKGYNIPSPDKVMKIADALNVNPMWLTGNDDTVNFSENFIDLYSLIKNNNEAKIIKMIKMIAKLDNTQIDLVYSLINQLQTNKKEEK